MTTEVTTRENMTPATMEPQGTSGEYDQSDFSLPYVTLLQAQADPVKQRKAMAGSFMSTDGETFDSINMVPLHIQFVRDFFDKDAQKAICGSKDRVTGYPRDLTFFATAGNINVEEGVPMLCKDCPFYEWAPSPKQACLKAYVVTCFDIDRDQPFMYRVRGTAVTPFKNAFVGAVAMGRQVPWGRQYEMTAKLTSYGGNSWFIPNLQPTKGHDKDELAQWAAYAAGFSTPAPEHVDADDLPFE